MKMRFYHRNIKFMIVFMVAFLGLTACQVTTLTPTDQKLFRDNSGP